MTDWLSYSATIDGKPGVVDIDVDLDDPAFMAANAVAIDVGVRGFPTDDAGMPTDEADDALYALEQRFESLLDASGGAVALTLVGAGAYRCVAYAPRAGAEVQFDQFVRDAGLQCSASSDPDPGWTRYRQWALAGEALEAARDRAQVDELEASGVATDETHELYFDFEFEKSDDATRAYEAINAAGYFAGDYEDDEEPTDGELLQVTVELEPTAEAVGEIRRKLTAIAAPLGGRFLGWGVDPDE